MTKDNTGPIYGVELIETLSLRGGVMMQQMPTRKDLESAKIRSERAVAGYEVLLEHWRELQQQNALWEQKASRLYDLLHECAQWIPRGQQDLYDRVTHELDSGLRYLDDTPIGDA